MNWKSKSLYRYRPEGIFRIFSANTDSGPPPVHMLLQQKKANSLVPAIFFPIAWPFEKGGDQGMALVYVFLFPEDFSAKKTQGSRKNTLKTVTSLE